MLADRLVAHRGFQKHYPENTLLAYEKAIEADAHYIETDILFSADGEPLLYHDITLKQVSGIDGFLHGSTLEQLLKLPAYEPERLGETYINNKITSLAQLVELLKQHPKVTVFIELKRAGIEIIGFEQCYKALIRILAPIIHQCVLISFNDQFIHYANQQGFKQLGLVLKDWQHLNKGYIADIQPAYIFCDKDKVPAEGDLDAITSTTVIYEIDSADEAAEWFNRGADMVERFDIGGMLEQLSHHAL